jgi:menaquinone-dependent protoporphyrinogen oxidase
VKVVDRLRSVPATSSSLVPKAMVRVLVTAATTHGATGEIARAIADVLADHGLEVDVEPPGDVSGVEGYDAVVLGSAVYAGRWLGPARALIERESDALARRPVWLFSSGPVGDPSRRLVRAMAAGPDGLPELVRATGAREHRMFAGRLEKDDLPFAQRAALTVFRGLEGDFRDWDEIRGWATGIAAALADRG